MENTPLHAQKVTILSRLIKESSLTLEEALVLLKEEEEAQEAPVFNPGTTTPWTVNNPSTVPLTIPGNGWWTTSSSNTGVLSGSSFTNGTISCQNTATADLNN